MCNSATNPHPTRPTLTFVTAAFLSGRAYLTACNLARKSKHCGYVGMAHSHRFPRCLQPPRLKTHRSRNLAGPRLAGFFLAAGWRGSRREPGAPLCHVLKGMPGMRRVLLRPAPSEALWIALTISSGMSASGRAGREPLRVAPMGFRVARAGMVGPQRMDGLQVHIHAPTVSPAAQHISAPMDLAHPAGAESLAPQPSQLASARNSPLSVSSGLGGRKSWGKV
jgi:hypothetical protein